MVVATVCETVIYSYDSVSDDSEGVGEGEGFVLLVVLVTKVCAVVVADSTTVTYSHDSVSDVSAGAGLGTVIFVVVGTLVVVVVHFVPMTVIVSSYESVSDPGGVFVGDGLGIVAVGTVEAVVLIE